MICDCCHREAGTLNALAKGVKLGTSFVCKDCMEASDIGDELNDYAYDGFPYQNKAILDLFKEIDER